MKKKETVAELTPVGAPKGEKKNEIVVYQPDKTLRLEVKLEDETVWLTQSQMAELFGCTTRNVRLHIENIYACGELEAEATGVEEASYAARPPAVGASVGRPHASLAERLLTDGCERSIASGLRAMSSTGRALGVAWCDII